jgi:hypothetical protein
MSCVHATPSARQTNCPSQYHLLHHHHPPHRTNTHTQPHQNPNDSPSLALGLVLTSSPASSSHTPKMQRNPKLFKLHIPTLPHRTPALRPHPLLRPPSSISPHTSALLSSRLFNFMPPLRYISSLQRTPLQMLKISSHHLLNTHNGAMPPCSHAWTSIKILGLSLSLAAYKIFSSRLGPGSTQTPNTRGEAPSGAGKRRPSRPCPEPAPILVRS